ncbi:MAG: hypothetical protein J0L92_06245 [Deltaproteobacteria bacterium]|nr:hypothetical protein [Deltaproteobacteria bacterium]
MSVTVVLEGPGISVERGVELIRAAAPLVIGRALDLREVERVRLDDQDGRSACWAARWVDGDVELAASVMNGDGNPRDGYGYSMSVKLLASYEGRSPGWRAELIDGGWEPMFRGPIRLRLLGVTPEALDAIRVQAVALLGAHRDVTFDDPYALREVVETFDREGHHAWVRDFLARPLRSTDTWVSASLCARKMALLGADPETARTWLTIEPFASLAWSALAEAGGDATSSEGDARILAALTNPFSPCAIERAASARPIDASALSAAMSHVFADPAWRWLDANDRDAYAARPDAWQPSACVSATWERPGHVPSAAVDREIATFFEAKGAARLETSYVHSGPPLAERGTLSHHCGIGTGHSVRRAIVELAPIAARSRVVAACQTNAEDRLACFGLVWLDATRHVVWRYVVHHEGEKLVRSPITFHLIDHGTEGWGAQIEASLGLRAAST